MEYCPTPIGVAEALHTLKPAYGRRCRTHIELTHMGRRFNSWKWFIKNPTALEEYKRYRAGTKTVSYTRQATSNPGSLDLVYIEPFSIAVAAGEGYQVTISKRAKDYAGNLLNSEAPLNWLAITDAAKKIDRPLQPARATITTGSTGTTNATSKITGISYKKQTGQASYTLPFGKVGQKTYAVVISDIEAALKTPDTMNINFQPEIWGKKQ